MKVFFGAVALAIASSASAQGMVEPQSYANTFSVREAPTSGCTNIVADVWFLASTLSPSIAEGLFAEPSTDAPVIVETKPKRSLQCLGSSHLTAE